MCEPCPRTMKGASPPTEPKARTGEFTPPGIICSARCCSLRDISVLRAMGSPKNWSYIVTAGGRNTAKSQHWEMHLYFLRLELSIKRDTEFTGYLQSRNSPETRSGYSLFSTRPSNREGFKDSFGGLRAVLIFLSCLITSGTREPGRSNPRPTLRANPRRDQDSSCAGGCGLPGFPPSSR